MPSAELEALSQERHVTQIRDVLRKRGGKEMAARVEERDSAPGGRSSVRFNTADAKDVFLTGVLADMADLATLVDKALELRGRPANVTFGEAKPKAKTTKDTKGKTK